MKALTDSFARELGAFGAGAGAAAATPAVGTTATLLAAMAELAWFTGRAGDLILTVAALHGRPSPSVEERRAWMLAVTKLPMATLQTVNRLLTPRLVKRYGARRGAIALGTTLPLGIGAIVGGSANYMAVRALARHADQFFSRLPYSAIDATATEVDGVLPSRRSD